MPVYATDASRNQFRRLWEFLRRLFGRRRGE
jgi:hypothetical protein